jgi:putative ABC transport system permease protein
MFRSKLFSLINISGLAIGLACCMFILIYVLDQFSYDRHHDQANDIYRVATITIDENKETPNVVSPAPLAAALQLEFPEVDKTARMFVPFNDDKSLIQYFNGGQLVTSFYESKGYLADPGFFQIFNYNFTEGDFATALQEPNTVVISQAMAQKLFHNSSAIDKIIRIKNSNGDIDFRITGVFAGSGKSHIDGKFFMSMKSGIFGQYANTWTDFAVNNIFYTYIKLKPGAYKEVLESKFPTFVKKYESKNLEAAGFFKKHFLQRVTDIHLRSALEGEFSRNGSITYIYVLILIAVFILVIACINFMNLSTARSSKRAVEVGIRKAVGAANNSLVKQFISESVLASMVALLLAIVLLVLLLPLFNHLTGNEVTFSALANPLYITAFIVLALIAGLLAGSYPAFYLSAFRPVQVLKGKMKNSFSAVFIRKGLVIFQFAIAIGLILASFIILQQMNYMKHQDLGFKQSQQIIIPLRTDQARKTYYAFKTEVKKSSLVTQASGTDTYPGTAVVADKAFYLPGKTMHEAVNVKSNWVDYDYAATLQIPLLAGRFFSTGFVDDTSGFSKLVLNEKAAKDLGFTPAQAIGKRLHFDWQGRKINYEIIGVTKNFHFEGLKEPIKAYSFEMQQGTYNYLIVQVNTQQMQSALRSLETAWKRLNTDEPFEYYFLDKQFQQNYEVERRTGSLITAFTIIAIFISCLGLYGLALFTAEQKIKEIGIRKVLGASVSNVVALLSKEFLQLVMIAALVAAPVAWWGMQQWLQHFAYHINIQWWVFVAAALLALLIALFTISFQAVKAAIANPIKSLRTE